MKTKISASEIRKAKLIQEEINFIVSNSGLSSIKPFLIEALKTSKNRKITPIELFELEGKIAIKIIECEKQIKIFKLTANREKRNNEWLSLEIYRSHKKILKEVMDGIAFRFLNFNRPLLRQLIAHNQTGALGDSFLDELEKAEYIINKTGNYVILNDLTNFLRYGDLTIISPEGIMIDEVKRTGNPKGNQKKILDEIIESWKNKVVKIRNQSAQYIKILGKPTTFLNQIESIINKSKSIKEGIYAEKVSPYLWVSSLYMPKVDEYYKTSGNFPKIPKIPFNIKDISPPTGSLMFFDQVSPNIAPFSIFPFSEDVICDILTGQIQIKTVINEKELIKSFKGKGWELSLPSKELVRSVYDNDNIDEIINATGDPKYFATLKKGNFSYKIPRENLLNIENEFFTIKSIVDTSESLMKTPMEERKLDMVITGFSEEYSIWR